MVRSGLGFWGDTWQCLRGQKVGTKQVASLVNQHPTPESPSAQ